MLTYHNYCYVIHILIANWTLLCLIVLKGLAAAFSLYYWICNSLSYSRCDKGFMLLLVFVVKKWFVLPTTHNIIVFVYFFNLHKFLDKLSWITLCYVNRCYLYKNPMLCYFDRCTDSFMFSHLHYIVHFDNMGSDV